MRLYHFTQLRWLKDIRKEGIKPAVYKQGMLPPHGVVWLTSKLEHTFGHDPECYISVFIPPTDKRLVKWEHGCARTASMQSQKRTAADGGLSTATSASCRRACSEKFFSRPPVNDALTSTSEARRGG
jgi:hypothetical protein